MNNNYNDELKVVYIKFCNDCPNRVKALFEDNTFGPKCMETNRNISANDFIKNKRFPSWCPLKGW